MRSRATALACSVGILLAPRAASGAPSGVSIAIDPCAGVPAPFVERVVAAELSGDARGDAAGVDVRVTCRDGLAVVTATTTGEEPLERAVDLEREDAIARPRVLSVAIAELVAAIRARPAPQPAKPAGPAPLPAAEPIATPPSAPPLPRSWTIGVSGVARGFGSFTGFGAGAWASYVSRAHLGVRADVDVTDARVSLALGHVGTRTASLGAQAIASGALGAFTIAGGAGLRGGLASLEGDPAAGAVGHTVTGVWGGPVALASLGWSLAPAWSIVATGEGGWVARETTGLVDGAPGVALKGAFASAALGLAWTP